MFDNIDKSKISFEQYIKLKSETMTKSYSQKFKWVDKFLYWFSWFGNGVSVFLAYFFMQAIFQSSFNDVKDSVFITLGILIFLTMFELLKRYIIAIFSNEVIKNNFNIFRSDMISFIGAVLLLALGSAYLSLSGAQKFVDNKQVFKTQTETSITGSVDSLNNVYLNNYIKPLKEENGRMENQNDELIKKTSRNSTVIESNNNLIATNKNQIKENKEQIKSYEDRRDREIVIMRQEKSVKLNETLSSNSSNTIAFIIISALVELIILAGIYYDKYYRYKILEEYEKTVIDTPQFKKWHRFNFLLGLIYSKTNEVGSQIPTTNGLMELAEINGDKLDKATLDKFIKVLYYLDIVRLEGNRRVLGMTQDNATQKLRDYFEIK